LELRGGRGRRPAAAAFNGFPPAAEATHTRSAATTTRLLLLLPRLAIIIDRSACSLAS